MRLVILPLQLLVVVGGRPYNEIAIGLFTIYRPTELWVGAYFFVISKEMTRRMKRLFRFDIISPLCFLKMQIRLSYDYLF